MNLEARTSDGDSIGPNDIFVKLKIVLPPQVDRTGTYYAGRKSMRYDPRLKSTPAYSN